MSLYLMGDIIIAYLLDLCLGDPIWLYHPVRAIGALIRGMERLLRQLIQGWVNTTGQGTAERVAGVILTLTTVGLTFGIVWGILLVAAAIHPVLFHILNIYLIYSAFATRCLTDEARKVYHWLVKGDLSEARRSVGMLVGRETSELREPEVIRAVVETTAENTVDGVISPLCFTVAGAFLGLAAPLVYAFKAVSTLDSMVGYKNEKYYYLGWASARLDDLANFFPARLAGVLIPASALLLGKGFLPSFRTMLRDRRNHTSPNCAYPEAAVAGALGVQLGGANIYFGQKVSKPTIGDPRRPLEREDIRETIKITYTASLLTLLISLLILALFLSQPRMVS